MLERAQDHSWLAVRAVYAGDMGMFEQTRENMRLFAGGQDTDFILLREGIIEALTEQMVECAFGQAKQLNKLRDWLIHFVPAIADWLIAQAFAEQASEASELHQDRLYKLSCRQAGIALSAKAFIARGVRVNCPLDGRHPVDELGRQHGPEPRPVSKRLRRRLRRNAIRNARYGHMERADQLLQRLAANGAIDEAYALREEYRIKAPLLLTTVTGNGCKTFVTAPPNHVAVCE